MNSHKEIIKDVGCIVFKDDPAADYKEIYFKLLTPLLETPDIKGIVLDFSVIEMLSSSGIGLMLGIYKEVEKKELPFVLVSNHYVEKILRMVALWSVLDTEESKEDAINRILEINQEINENEKQENV